MTLRKSSNRSNAPFAGTLTLFASHLRQGWSALLVYSLIAVCVPLLSLLGISGSRMGEQLYELVYASGGEVVFYVACGIAAMVAAAYTWRYLHERKHNYFESKLPYRREALYTGSVLYGLVLFILPLLLMVGIFAVLGLVTIPAAVNNPDIMLPVTALAQYLSALLRYFLYSVASYVMFFSVFTLGAVICGHMAMAIGFSVFLLFFFVLFGLLNEELFFHITGMEIDACTLLDILKISPINVFRWVGKFEGQSLGVTALHSLWMALGGVGALVLGLFIHHIRKSERTGLAFAFPAIGQIFKYAVLYLALGAVGLFVHATGGSFIIGILLMAVVGFGGNLVINMILQKNFRRGLFRGWKGLLILYVVTVVLYVLAEAGLAFLPPASRCESISYELIDDSGKYQYFSYPRTIRLTKKDDIEKFTSYLRPHSDSIRLKTQEDIDWFDKGPVETVSVRYQLKSGLAVRAAAYCPKNFNEILQREGLYTEAGLAASLREFVADVDRLTAMSTLSGMNFVLSGKEARELLLCMVSEWEERYDLIEGLPKYNGIAFTVLLHNYGGSYVYYEFPVYEEMTKTMALAGKLLPDMALSVDEIISDMIEAKVTLNYWSEFGDFSYKIFLEGDRGKKVMRDFLDCLSVESNDGQYTEIYWMIETDDNTYSVDRSGFYDPALFRDLFRLGDEPVVKIS